MSIVPSLIPSINASISSLFLNGGFTLKLVSKSIIFESSSNRLYIGTSHVTFNFFFFASLISDTDSLVEIPEK